MENNTNIWSTGTLPTTIAVNGYTVTLERKEREQATATRTKGLQTLYFGTIADSDGNITPVEGKPLTWIKKRVGDNTCRAYTRLEDGKRIAKTLSDDEINSACESYRTTLTTRYTFAQLCEHLGGVEVVSHATISAKVEEYRAKLKKEQQRKAMANAEREQRAKVKEATANLSNLTPEQLNAILNIINGNN